MICFLDLRELGDEGTEETGETGEIGGKAYLLTFYNVPEISSVPTSPLHCSP